MKHLINRENNTKKKRQKLEWLFTNPCWQWYYGLAGGSTHGRWFGGPPWYSPLWLPMMAPSGPWQKLNSLLWRCLYKSIRQMPPWCGRDQGWAGCWWYRTCALQSNTRRTCTTETRWDLHSERLWALSHLGFSHYSILFVSVKGGKRKTFPLVLPKEFTLLQADVMHLISRAAPVGAVPLVCWTHTPLPGTNQEIPLAI